MSGNSTAELQDYGDATIWYVIIKTCEYIFPIQAIFGILGNIMNIYVLCSKTMRGRTNMLLSAAAICDILFIACLSLNYIPRFKFMIKSSTPCNRTPEVSCMNWFYDFYVNYKPQITFSANMFSLMSTWINVTVCFDRLWAIKAPLKSHGQGGCNKGLFGTILIIGIMSVALTGFHNFAFKIVPADNKNGNLTGMNNGLHSMKPSEHRLSIMILAIIGVCFQIVIPLTLLVGSNCMLLYHIRNRNQHFQIQRWNASKNSFDSYHSTDDESRSSSKIWSKRYISHEKKITTTVICIVTCYIVTNLPSGILFIIIYIVNHGIWYRNRCQYALVVLSTGIVVLGKIINFILLCNSSSYFRRQFYKQCFEKLMFFRRKPTQTPQVHYAKLERVDIRP